MEFERCFSQEWNSISSENTSGCFDCNICLDFPRDPVVTLCGHLYCWPCIYKWFHFQTASLSSDENASLASDKHRQCPVCKANVSDTTVVPLYGRGGHEAEVKGKAPSIDMAIPPRPPACGTKSLMTTTSQSVYQVPYPNPYQDRPHSPYGYRNYEEDSSPPSLSLSSSGLHPGMFGEMIYSRMFGNSESLYAYPNSYHSMGSSSPRLRRQEMQVEKSLNRVSIFLFCCFILCLLLF